MLHQVRLLLLLGLALFVRLLNVLDQPERVVQVGARRAYLARLADVGGSVGQFLEEGGLGISEAPCAALLPDGGARVEKVDPEVGVVALDALWRVS